MCHCYESMTNGIGTPLGFLAKADRRLPAPPPKTVEVVCRNSIPVGIVNPREETQWGIVKLLPQLSFVVVGVILVIDIVYLAML